MDFCQSRESGTWRWEGTESRMQYEGLGTFSVFKPHLIHSGSGFEFWKRAAQFSERMSHFLILGEGVPRGLIIRTSVMLTVPDCGPTL